MNLVPEKKRKEIEAVYQAHKMFMLRLAFRYVNDQGMAEDIVHDAVVRLLENYKSYDLRDVQRAKGLVAKIVIGLSLNHLKKSCREVPSPEEDFRNGTEERYPSHDSSAYYLGQLEPDDAFILRKQILEGFSTREIAQMVHCREPALRKRLQRAKERLQKVVEVDYEQDGEVRR